MPALSVTLKIRINIAGSTLGVDRELAASSEREPRVEATPESQLFVLRALGEGRPEQNRRSRANTRAGVSVYR